VTKAVTPEAREPAVTSLGQLTWQSAKQHNAETTILAVPLGATEQHGPHLPLTTDTEIAVALVDMLSRRCPDVVEAPPLPYGSSGEHAGFPGTVSIGQDAVELVLLELCRSASESFRKILLVCAHGGNAEPIRRAISRLIAEGRTVLAWHPSWDGDTHAGRIETSIMLALAPDRVDLSLAQPGATEPIETLLPRLRREGVSGVSPNGILGDPDGACAEDGHRLLAAAAANLIATVEAWAPCPEQQL
jgi:creatinine amidohydrolase